jgi:hypothetical protein
VEVLRQAEIRLHLLGEGLVRRLFPPEGNWFFNAATSSVLANIMNGAAWFSCRRK